MRAQDIISESPWWERDESTTLFHGTSSSLLPMIEQDGIVPPTTEFEEMVWSLLDQYMEEIEATPEEQAELRELAENTIRYRRRDQGQEEFASAVYLTPDRKMAERYAIGYAKHGGEVAYELWEKVRRITGRSPRQKFPDGEPVVLEVEVPTSWVIGRKDLDNHAMHLRKVWADKYQDKEPWDEFIADASWFEVRVTKTIPPEMIAQVHQLETLTESRDQTGIEDLLGQRGYTKIGKGNFTSVWEHPSKPDTVLRVSNRGDCWEKYARTILGSDNPHFPRIEKLGTRQGLLIARMERLWPVDAEAMLKENIPLMAYIAVYVTKTLDGSRSQNSDWAASCVRHHMWKQTGTNPSFGELELFAVEQAQGVEPSMADALDVIANLGCLFDFDFRNFMRRKDGTLVVVDPVSYERISPDLP